MMTQSHCVHVELRSTSVVVQQPGHQRGPGSVCVFIVDSRISLRDFGCRTKLQALPDGTDLYSTMARTRSSLRSERPTLAFLNALGIEIA